MKKFICRIGWTREHSFPFCWSHLRSFSLCHCVTTKGRRNRGEGRPPELGTSDDPVPTKGSDHAHHITIRPSEFSDLPTALDPRNPAALPRKQLLVCVASCCAAVCVWCWFYRQWLRAAVLTYGTLVKLHLSSLSILYIGFFTYFKYVLRVLGIDLHSVK